MEYEVKKDEIVFTHGVNVFNQENTNIFNSHDVTSSPGSLKRKKAVTNPLYGYPATFCQKEFFL